MSFLQRRTQEVVAARMDQLYGWQVDPDWIIATPGVVSGFNIAARAVCSVGGWSLDPAASLYDVLQCL